MQRLEIALRVEETVFSWVLCAKELNPLLRPVGAWEHFFLPASPLFSLPPFIPPSLLFFPLLFLFFLSSFYLFIFVGIVGFPGGLEGKASACNAETWVQSLSREDSPGEGIGYPLQYSCLENPMDGGVWEVAAHGVTKSRTRLSHFTFLSLGVKSYFSCRKMDPFQGLKLGSCLTFGNELSEETHMLTKQEILLGKGTHMESSRVREPRRTALPHGPQSRVLWWWD